MSELLSGIIESIELMEPSETDMRPVGIVLRSVENWQTPIVVGANVKLVFPDGSWHFSRIKGGEIMTSEAPGSS